MSDTDISLFSGSAAVKDRLQRYIKKSIDGRLTETDRQDILQTVDILEKIQQDKINGVKKRSIERFSEASSDITRESANRILNGTNSTKDRDDRIKKFFD